MKHSDNFEAACYLAICTLGSALIYDAITDDNPLFIVSVFVWWWVFSKLWNVRKRGAQKC